MACRVFISQPMNGKQKWEIMEDRRKAIEYAKEIRGEDVEIIDSYLEGPEWNVHPLKCLAKSLDLMADADLAIFVTPWQSARGCQIEHDCAEKYGIESVCI